MNRNRNKGFRAHRILFSRVADAVSIYCLLIVAPIVCTIVGLFFFHLAAFACTTLQAETSLGTIRYGYWKVESGSDCIAFGSDSFFTSAVQVSRAFGVIGSLITGVVFVLIMTACCFRFPRSSICERTGQSRSGARDG